MSGDNTNSLAVETQPENALYSPIKIEFEGWETDKHYIDAELFGLSINGSAKIYNNASHLFYTGIIPSNKTKRDIRMYAKPPAEGSVTYTMWCIVILGRMSLYPQLWGEIADFFIPEIVKATYMKFLNKRGEMEKIVDKILEHSEKTQSTALSAMLQSQNRFLDTIDNLADGLKGPIKKSVEPIGRSCKTMNYIANNNQFLAIDEPMAEVIRSKEQLEVDDMKNYKCLIRGVDTITGNAKIQLENVDVPLMASISDPSLMTVGNIYTNALDNQREVEIIAKATLKNGKINKLFISDAKFTD